MNLPDWLIVGFLIFVRLGLPILASFGLAYVYDKWAARRDAERATALRNAAIEAALRASDTGFPVQAERCWELKGCSPETRAGCPAYLRPNIPCWMALQLDTGRLNDRCLECELFQTTLSPSRDVPL